MIKQSNSLLNGIDISLDYLISLLSIALEIYLQQNLDTLQYFSFGLLFLAGLAKLIEKKKFQGIQQDYAPFFFWMLALLRIIFIKNIKKDQTIFLLYNMGFSNGQYMGRTPIRLINQLTEVVKAFIQFGTLIGLLIYYCDTQFVSIVLQIFMMLFIQYQNYRENVKLLEVKKEEFDSQSCNYLNGSLNKFLCKSPERQEINIIKVESISRHEVLEDPNKNQVENQPPTQNIVWNQLIEQSEDYISKFYLSVNNLEDNINSSQNNYQMCMFLQDNKCQLISLFKDIKISNDLNVKLYESNNLDKNQDSLFDWIQSNINIQKFYDQNQKRGVEENLVVSSPIAQQSVIMMDAYVEKSISGISAIKLVQGSLDVSNLKNRKVLYGKYNGRKQNYNFYIQISFFEEEINSIQSQTVAIIIRDVEKQVRQIKINLKNIQKINSTIKFLKIQDALIQKIHKKIILQQNQIIDIQRSRQTTQFNKRTNSICSYKDSDDGLSDISEKQQKNVQIIQFINQLQFQFMKITQNNSNYFEVFPINELGELKKEIVDIAHLITQLIYQFQYDEIVIGKKINITLSENLINKKITTDIRLLKQLLFNIIYNSIQSYSCDYKNTQIQKIVQIVLCNNDDNIRFQIIDYGCGLKEENINHKRLDDCKLGLAASQKLIKLLGGNDKQLQILRSQQKHQTIVSFELPKFIFVDRLDFMIDDFEFETIQLLKTS